MAKVIHHGFDSVPDLAGLESVVAIFTLLDRNPLPEWAVQDCLSATEHERLDRTRHAAAKERFRRGRVFLRNVLGRILDLPPADVALTMGEYGKPMAAGIHFNMSHTEGVMVLAVSRNVVGVDVEVPAAGRDIHGLVYRWFTEAERRQFAALPAELQPEAFLRGWTCKEAVLKTIGTGVRDLQNVSVDLDPRQPPRVLECPGSVGWELECWSLEGSRAALCYSPPHPQPLPREGRGE